MQLKIALVAALLAIATDVCSLISLREEFGTGWLFWVVLSSLKYMIYLFMLALALNGRAWVRYAYVFGTLLSVFALSKAGPGAFGDPFVVSFLAISVVAIALWFSDSSQAWYRDPLVSDTEYQPPSDVR